MSEDRRVTCHICYYSDRRSQGSAILHLLGTSTVTDEQLGKEAENLPPDDGKRF